MDESKSPMLVHLAELKVCLIRASIGLLLGMMLCYFFADQILAILKHPMLDVMGEGASFVVLSPQEYFFTELKASFFLGTVLASPWIFFQLWLFIAPGLYRCEKLMVIWFVMAASLCFVLGVVFAYFAVFPPTFRFFIESLPPGVVGTYSIGMLYGFAISVLLAFGVIFQMPIAVFLSIWFGLISVDSLAKYRRFIFVGSFVVGALLTPPDPITQIMLAVPAYCLFELGLWGARVALCKREFKEKRGSESLPST